MWGNSAKDMKILSKDGKGETFADVMRQRMTRRNMLKGFVVATAVAAASQTPLAKMVLNVNSTNAEQLATTAQFPLGFAPIAGTPASVDVPSVAPGHKIQTLIRWGDPITNEAPEFDPTNLTAVAQAQQFGYNCDFVGFFPLVFASKDYTKGLLVVNHEYTNQHLMWQDYDIDNVTQEQVDVEMAAHGMTVVEIEWANGQWQYVRGGKLNRRYTMMTPKILAGPVAGSSWVQTTDDPTGANVLGTINNCSGGKTPWGTVLSGEENFQSYFGNVDLLPDGETKSIHNRYGVQGGTPSFYNWLAYYARFDTTQEINEPFRFGWVVEVDPYDPSWTPRKRTALGRFRHEAATTVIANNNKVVAYSGDDSRFEYLYKYVSQNEYNPNDRLANRDGDLLDNGILYVAKFNANGSGEWLPLVHGQNGLDGEVTIGKETFTFNSQADVLVKTRLAADFLGATKMDRPEDVETNPVTGKVYVALTNNSRRDELSDDEGENAVNPRLPNVNGHIVEITEDNDDHTSTTFTWEIFMLCGIPGAADENLRFEGFPEEELNNNFSGIAAPDNITFDDAGNLWISTDGQPSRLGLNDGLFAVPTEGDQRGHVGQFFSSVTDSEVCGPEFTPDFKTLFLAIQHPGDSSESYDNPTTRWPDFDLALPPRPSLVAIQAITDEKVGQLTQPYQINLPFIRNNS